MHNLQSQIENTTCEIKYKIQEKNIKVLVLDEESIIPEIKEVVQVLHGYNFIFYNTTCGNEFKELIKKNKPNLIISELHLNEVEGKEQLDYCRMVYPEIPFIIFSSHTCNKSALDFLELGATDFLTKDNSSALPATIYKALRQSLEKLQIKEAKQQRWEDAQRFKGLIEYSHDPVITYDYDGTITYASPAIERVLGYKVEEFVGTNVIEHIHPDDLPIRENAYKMLLESEMNFETINEERLLHKNGHFIWAKAVISDARLIPGIEGFMTNFRDITVAKNKTRDLNNTIEILTSQNNRLLNFSYIVSHNLRSHTSNIQSIINYLDITDDPKEQLEMIQHLKEVSEALNETMINLNEVVSIQSGENLKIESLSLRKYALISLKTLKSKLHAINGKVHFDIDKNLNINFNKSYLESILHNLFYNAIKYSHPERMLNLEISTFEEEDFVVLKVKDNGLGLDIKKYKNKLFGMYNTFHSNKNAKGLGLFMSKNQIEAMKGKIEVEGGIDKGCTFKIYFKK
ncbi:PAS domain S-box protein [Planktosalinus lacus]|uniref:histidine kinase n=1 Tax=Planktosalinus lacus TaxID=1526573 RepID=A0A8J2VAI2_9FLAO|nr:PAS domain S-box protein [Planktosalinus lacus]GGD92468.1 hypothetical protein GCM10011312_15380 [Planktosalinus lacus]